MGTNRDGARAGLQFLGLGHEEPQFLLPGVLVGGGQPTQ